MIITHSTKSLQHTLSLLTLLCLQELLLGGGFKQQIPLIPCSHPCWHVTDSQLTSESKLCYNQRSLDQFVLVSNIHLGPKTRFFITARQLWVCWCGAPSLTRGWVCLLQLLYQHIKTCSIEVFWLLRQPLPHLVRHNLQLLNIRERISPPDCEPLCVTNTSHCKQH
jgi:hypothetical protein